MKSMVHMGKRLMITMVMVLCGVLFSAQRVNADVIWEPMDSFYMEHRGQCEYINRSYTTSGPDNLVVVYESPVSAKVVKELENDVRVYVSYVYQDAEGIAWGVYEEENVVGWFPMDYMTVVYDHISFAEDFDEQIVEEQGQVDASYGNTEIYYWSYPGSMDGNTFMLMNDNTPSYSRVYVDELGRKWGFVGYYYGIKSVWICLDAPSADYETLYPEGAAIQEKIAEEKAAQGIETKESATEEPDTKEADIKETDTKENNTKENDSKAQEYETERIVPKDATDSYVGIVSAMVIAVIAVTAGLLWKLKG